MDMEGIVSIDQLKAAAEGKAFRQLEDSKVRWYFDGQVRHRLHSQFLRNKPTVVDLNRRKEAVGKVRDFPNDRLITYLTENAEAIFEPKRILTNGDWLKSYREPDQFFDKYANCNNGSHKWIDPNKNKLYLFMMDNQFAEADIQNYKKYAQAFFPGTDVDIIRQGTVLPGQREAAKYKKMVPKNFLKDEKITCRCRDDIEEGWIQYSTHGDHGLLKTLPRFKPQDAYAVIGLTNEDLYPGKNWNFCFGWATYNVGVGAFSFCRYDPSFDGIDTSSDPDAETNLLMKGCHIMAHELGHMFGLKHCIYYECLMNGLNSAEE